MTVTTITQQLPEKDLATTKIAKKELNHIEAINIATALAKIHKVATDAQPANADTDYFEMRWSEHFEALKDANIPQGRQGDVIQEVKRQLIRYRPTLDLRAKKAKMLAARCGLENTYVNEDKATIYLETTRTEPMHCMHQVAEIAMQLQLHNLPELADDFTNAYINQQEEVISQPLLNFYKAERAFTKAVDAQLKDDEEEMLRYWSMAASLLLDTKES